MNKKIELIKMLLEKYPESHIGGSFGLLFHGVDLKRQPKDIDLIVKYPIKAKPQLEFGEMDESSDTEDFHNRYRYYDTPTDSVYTKVDISLQPDQKFVVIAYNGITLRVSELPSILLYKGHYARKGVQKHIDDMINITGEVEKWSVFQQKQEVDDLPF